MSKIIYDSESSSDDVFESLVTSSRTPKKQKLSAMPWSKLFSGTKANESKAVIEISDSDSVVSECSDSDFETPVKKRKRGGSSKARSSRSILEYDDLAAETQQAKSAEKRSIIDRKEKEIFMASLNESESLEIVLDVNEATNQKIVIHKQLVKHLKPHQIEGVKHMFNCCYGSVKGSGCILAHCMGLGKTLQLITLLHTVVNYPQFATNRILILCPKSTLSNWKAEIHKWIGSIRKARGLKVFEFADSRPKDQQLDRLRIWNKYSPKNENAACFLMSYESFRSLVFYGQQNSKKNPKTAKTTNRAKESQVQNVVQSLLTATDMVVCDEGHMIKSLKSVTNRAVSQLKTRRRIVLTGTPMQNNLLEYHAMVNFVKPSFLGTVKEFKRIYANPIAQGQHKDSTSAEIRMMRMQSFNLNRELESFVHRREASLLMKMLPEKLEYVLYIPLSEKQSEIYEFYLNQNPLINGKKLFADYSTLRKIWTHPKQLELSYEKAVKLNTSIVSVATRKAINFGYGANNGLDDYANLEAGVDKPNSAVDLTDESDSKVNPTTSMTHDWWRPFVTNDDLNSISQGPTRKEINFGYEAYNGLDDDANLEAGVARPNDAVDLANGSDSKVNPTTSMTRDWWRPFVTNDDLNSILHSPKFEIMFAILKECQQRSEKCLIFSTSVVCLNIVEIFLKKIVSWKPERDYFRLDGSTSSFQRTKLIKEFNKTNNRNVKAFLISIKAGGQGINLTAANRIILLDTSWNPSIDQQSIYRIFRFGQQKNCCIYRLLSMGTMEEKIYSRSVTKQAMSFRVVDKQQIDRNYNMADLEALYTLTKPDWSEREPPSQPKDELLEHLLTEFPYKVFKYHEHETLLDNKNEEELTEEEIQEAVRMHEEIKKKNVEKIQPDANDATVDSTDNVTSSDMENPFDTAVVQALNAGNTFQGCVLDNIYTLPTAFDSLKASLFSNTSNDSQPEFSNEWLQSSSNAFQLNVHQSTAFQSNEFQPNSNGWPWLQSSSNEHPAFQTLLPTSSNAIRQGPNGFQPTENLNLSRTSTSSVQYAGSSPTSFLGGKRNGQREPDAWSKRIKMDYSLNEE